MVAATTMSLPERAGQGRNYDYRYAWIRDQCYTGQAVAVAGPHPLLDEAVRFVTERLLADGPHLKPAYTVAGGAVPDERSPAAARLSRAVPTSSATTSANQFQFDIFGEALLLFAAAARLRPSRRRWLPGGHHRGRSDRRALAASPMPASGSWTISAGRIPD